MTQKPNAAKFSRSILITDKVHDLLLSGLKEDGHFVTYKPKQTLKETLNVAHNYDGIIINSKTICDRTFFERAVKLDFIGRLGSGLDIIDLSLAKAKNVHVISTPEANCGAVAEHALGMILCLINNIKKSSDQVSHLIWQREENRGTELSSKTIGIIGYGHTGSVFAELLQPFGCRILCYDKYKSTFPNEASLKEIQENADMISLHLPLTEETIHYIDSEFISHCRKPIYIINTARGQNICTQSLIKAIDHGQVLGACLDVLENEKPETYSTKEKNMYQHLTSLSNVICTPHVAGWSHESLERIALTMLEKIRSLP